MLDFGSETEVMPNYEYISQFIPCSLFYPFTAPKEGSIPLKMYFYQVLETQKWNEKALTQFLIPLSSPFC